MAQVIWVAFLLIGWVVGANHARAADGPTDGQRGGAQIPPAARGAKAQYDDEIRRLQKEYEVKAEKAKDAFRRKLDEILVAETKRGNLDGALSVRAMKEALRQGSASTQPTTAPAELVPVPVVAKQRFVASSNNGCTVMVNGTEIMRAWRDKASEAEVELKPGDIITVSIPDRFDINSLWLICVTPEGGFLFETSEAWASYIPADSGRWWELKGLKIEQRPAAFCSPKQEYVDLVREAAAKTKYYRGTQPIRSVLDAGGRSSYIYYVVNKRDLVAKK